MSDKTMTDEERADFILEHVFEDIPNSSRLIVINQLKQAREEGLKQGLFGKHLEEDHDIYYEPESSLGEHLVDCHVCQRERQKGFREGVTAAAKEAERLFTGTAAPLVTKIFTDSIRALLPEAGKPSET